MARGVRRQDMKTRLRSRKVMRLGWLLSYMWRVGRALFVILFVCLAIGWMWQGGVFGRVGEWAHERYVMASASAGLVLHDVQVRGRHYLPASALREAIDVTPGVPLMGIDLENVQSRVAALPWVKSVHVRRTLGGVLSIDMQERVPVALWVDATPTPAVVDAEGVVLARDNIEQYMPILAVSGRDAHLKAQSLIVLLKAEPHVAVRVKQANFISGRRWDLVLDNGTIIKLPQNDPGHALARLAKMATEAKADGPRDLLDYGYASIDLRHSGRIIVENKPGDIRDLLSNGGDAV